MSASAEVISLVEYQSKALPQDRLSEAQARTLYDLYRDRVSVEPPSFKTAQQWVLRSEGWVGHLPVTPDLCLSIEPKVPVANLFEMLELAYKLRVIEFPDVRAAGSLSEFYERVALILARRVLDRSRRGLYASYVGQREMLPCVRGAIDLRHRVCRPWEVSLVCDYQEHTADVPENQILAWTLWRIAHSGLCSDRVLPTVRRACHAVWGMASPVPCPSSACVGRLYNRLNDDYQPLHALCRFFLESAGPTTGSGEHGMIPFVVEMSRLFELFVAEWLRAHLKPALELRYQDALSIGERGEWRLEMDMVLYDRESGRPCHVIDAKYKTPDKPDNADLYQVVAYAEALGCSDAVLVYPSRRQGSGDVIVGQKRVRTVAFPLDGDLGAAGAQVLEQLGLG